jgi:hypothetical protein
MDNPTTCPECGAELHPGNIRVGQPVDHPIPLVIGMLLVVAGGAGVVLALFAALQGLLGGSLGAFAGPSN